MDFLPMFSSLAEKEGLYRADQPESGGEAKKQPFAADDTYDFILISGDAYVDHPSFGAAIISRLLEAEGFRVSIIAQPDWNSLDSFKFFGKPRLAFLISAGNLDSCVNHYTVAKKLRKEDSYSPGGRTGQRPDRACIVYGNKLREAYQQTPIILGGLEASLRRLSHYDYWSNKVRRSVLLDSAADLLIYGMGERAMIEVAQALQSGLPIEQLTFIDGTVYKTKSLENVYDYLLLPEYHRVSSAKEEGKEAFEESFLLQYENTDHFTAFRLVEEYIKNPGAKVPDDKIRGGKLPGDKVLSSKVLGGKVVPKTKDSSSIYVVQNKPAAPLSTSEMDRVYSFKYMRTYHPIYQALGGVPALTEVEFSLTSSRGCFGSCNFCALSFHQGRIIQSRSHQSLVVEAMKLTNQPNFKGYIHDVGGPTANFRQPACQKQLTQGACKNKKCLHPAPCKNLVADHSDYLTLLRKLRQLSGIKKVFVRSGIRYDYILADKNGDQFLKELIEHHISGQLKIAPEHISPTILNLMGKPQKNIYEAFVKRYNELNVQLGKKQFLVPYLMSSHPGSDLKAAMELNAYLREKHCRPEQVQDFYPTPGTLSTCMYYTGRDPFTKKKLYVAKTLHEKAMQRALLQENNPKNKGLVGEAKGKIKGKFKENGKEKRKEKEKGNFKRGRK